MAIQVRQANNRRGGRVGVKLSERDPLYAAGTYRDYDFHDRFNRANSAALGNTETGETYVYSGNAWGIVSNMAYLSSTGGDPQAMAVVDTGNADVGAEFLAPVASAGSYAQGFGLRYSDTSNRVMAFWTPNGSLFYIYYTTTATGWLVASSVGGTFVDGDRLSVTCIGNTVTLYKNGTQLLSGTIPAGLASFTKHGLMNESASNLMRYDNLVVRNI